MPEPRASRPHMPGYGILGPDEGSGLLPWSWALERLSSSTTYWLSTVWPDGRPHVMPVWAVWDADHLWFSSSVGSRKIRNLRADPRCVATAENPAEPVVLEGIAEIVTEPAALDRMLALENAKYATDTASRCSIRPSTPPSASGRAGRSTAGDRRIDQFHTPAP